jgi:hypothetical protein
VNPALPIPNLTCRDCGYFQQFPTFGFNVGIDYIIKYKHYLFNSGINISSYNVIERQNKSIANHYPGIKNFSVCPELSFVV